MVAIGPDTIQASWDPPPQDARNGIILAYNLTCQPEVLTTALPTTYPAAGIYRLTGFSPATTYNCTIFASTAGGNGPPAIEVVTLLDDGN